jgi:trk system potassium uptake protein TrkA
MNIIILGDNQVARGLTETLCQEDHDVTIVGTNGEALAQLSETYDVRTIEGFPSYPNILRQAGAETADMLIAVTSKDEVNMIACEVAHAIYHTPTKIARIRAHEYLDKKLLFGGDVISIDHCISPEKMITEHIVRLLTYPGALNVYDFAEGKIRMVLTKPYYGGVLIGKTLAELNEILPDTPFKVVAIFREKQSIRLKKNTVIETEDELLFLSTRDNIRSVLQALGRFDSPNKRIMIAGGGNIGFNLAQRLESTFQVKLIENNAKRADNIASEFSSTTVLVGDVSDKKLLLNENIENMDVFVAVTNDDEANIMSCLQAKQLGARQTMALVKRLAYVELIEAGDIDIAISPQQITVGSILAHIRQADIANVYTLPNFQAEIMEIVVHGSENTSKVVGSNINDLKLPSGVSIAGIIRNDNLLLNGAETIMDNDRLLFCVEDSKRVTKIEQLLQVSATYM